VHQQQYVGAEDRHPVGGESAFCNPDYDGRQGYQIDEQGDDGQAQQHQGAESYAAGRPAGELRNGEQNEGHDRQQHQVEGEQEIAVGKQGVDPDQDHHQVQREHDQRRRGEHAGNDGRYQGDQPGIGQHQPGGRQRHTGNNPQEEVLAEVFVKPHIHQLEQGDGEPGENPSGRHEESPHHGYIAVKPQKTKPSGRLRDPGDRAVQAQPVYRGVF